MMAQYIDTFPGREILIEGKKHLYFGGTAYLGLQTDKAFQNLFIENVKRYGTNYSASRKSNVRMSIFEEAERYLADLVGTEACVTVSSGYMAGQCIAQSLHTKHHRFFYAPNSHSAMYPIQAKSYTTFTALNIAVREHLRSERGKSEKGKSTPVVFLDAIDFSGCNYPDFEPLQLLPLNQIIMVVDDSHGIGIIGENGGGVCGRLSSLPIRELVVCCSLGKGFGIQAGAVFGSTKRISELMETSFFGGASPAAPAALQTLLDAEAIYAERRKLLKGHLDYFVQNLRHPKKFHSMKGHPAFTFFDVQVTEYLQSQKIIVTSFPYPETGSQIMSRIVLSAAHTRKDIDTLIKHLAECFY